MGNFNLMDYEFMFIEASKDMGKSEIDKEVVEKVSR